MKKLMRKIFGQKRARVRDEIAAIRKSIKVGPPEKSESVNPLSLFESMAALWREDTPGVAVWRLKKDLDAVESDIALIKKYLKISIENIESRRAVKKLTDKRAKDGTA